MKGIGSLANSHALDSRFRGNDRTESWGSFHRKTKICHLGLGSFGYPNIAAQLKGNHKGLPLREDA